MNKSGRKNNIVFSVLELFNYMKFWDFRIIGKTTETEKYCPFCTICQMIMGKDGVPPPNNRTNEEYTQLSTQAALQTELNYLPRSRNRREPRG